MANFLSRKKSKTSADQPRRRGTIEAPSSSLFEESQRYAFRRNRTITGSSSASVASSNELNAELRSPRAHVHHLSAHRRRLGWYLLLVIVISMGLYVLLSQLIASSIINISHIDALSPSDKAGYAGTIDDYFAARPVERFRFLLNTKELLSHIQASHPEIAGIAVGPSGTFGKADVRLTTRRPIARWNIHGDEQYVDAAGIVYKKNYYTVPSLQIIDKSGIPTTTDKVVTSHRFLGFIGRVVGFAEEHQLRVTKITIPPLTTREVDMRLKGVGQRYKLSVDRSAAEQVEDVSRITNYLKRKGITPSYVDVRIEGKAFYK